MEPRQTSGFKLVGRARNIEEPGRQLLAVPGPGPGRRVRVPGPAARSRPGVADNRMSTRRSYRQGIGRCLAAGPGPGLVPDGKSPARRRGPRDSAASDPDRGASPGLPCHWQWPGGPEPCCLPVTPAESRIGDSDRLTSCLKCPHGLGNLSSFDASDTDFESNQPFTL
jgi:hypothetical protein